MPNSGARLPPPSSIHLTPTPNRASMSKNHLFENIAAISLQQTQPQPQPPSQLTLASSSSLLPPQMPQIPLVTSMNQTLSTSTQQSHQGF